MHHQALTISSGTIIRAIIIGLSFYLLYVLRDIVLVFLTSVTIAASIEPAIKWIMKKGVPRVFAVIIIFLSIAFVAVAGFYLFLPTFISDMQSLVSSLPHYVSTETAWNPLKETSIGGILPEFSIKNIVDGFSTTFSDVTGGLFSTVSGIFGGIVSFLLIVVLSFYLSVQEEGIGNFLRVVTPERYEPYLMGLWKRSEKKIGLWLQGQLLLAVIIGVLTFLGLSILGVPSAMFLALVAAVLELIPVFGLLLSLIPAVAIALADGGITLAIMVLGLYIIIQQFENHLIYPLVVRKIIGIPPILVIITLLVGAKLAGFLGILLSVPLAAVLVEIFNDLEQKKIPRPH